MWLALKHLQPLSIRNLHRQQGKKVFGNWVQTNKVFNRKFNGRILFLVN